MNPTLGIEVRADSATHHLANVIESSTRLSDSKVNKSCSDQMFGIYLVSSQIGIDLPSLSLFNSGRHRIRSSSSFVFRIYEMQWTRKSSLLIFKMVCLAANFPRTFIYEPPNFFHRSRSIGRLVVYV